MHFICRDSPYGVHFIRRDCSYGVHFNSNSKVHALSGLYPSSFFFSILPTNYTGEQNKKKKRCPEYFTWFRSIRDHRCLNEKPFFPIGSSFPTISGFWGNFLGSWEIFWSFKNSLWTFYCTQNECLNAMVSMQNRFKKWATPGQDIWEKQNWVAISFCVPCLNFFYKYLGTGWSVFQTDLFIETMGSKRWLWVQ